MGLQGNEKLFVRHNKVKDNEKTSHGAHKREQIKNHHGHGVSIQSETKS